MNLSRIVEHWAGMTPGKCAVHLHGMEVTYAQLWRRIEIATATLSVRHAVKEGERIAWLGLNHPDFIVFLMALARLGAIAVPLNMRLATPELVAILRQSGTRLLFRDEAFADAGAAAARAEDEGRDGHGDDAGPGDLRQDQRLGTVGGGFPPDGADDL